MKNKTFYIVGVLLTLVVSACTSIGNTPTYIVEGVVNI